MNNSFERLEHIAVEYFGGFSALGKILNKPRSVFYSYKKKGKFGRRFLDDLEKIGINPEYIRIGQKPMFLNTSSLDKNAKEKYLNLSEKIREINEPTEEYKFLDSTATKDLVDRLIRIPLYKEIAYANTGTIIPDIQQFRIGETIELNPVLGGKPEHVGAVEVTGDSMSGYGIVSGSKVLFNKAIEPKNNNIVVVIINGQLMVKKLVINNGEYEFHSGDDGVTPPIVGCPDDICKIIGVVTDTLIKFI